MRRADCLAKVCRALWSGLENTDGSNTWSYPEKGKSFFSSSFYLRGSEKPALGESLLESGRKQPLLDHPYILKVKQTSTKRMTYSPRRLRVDLPAIVKGSGKVTLYSYGVLRVDRYTCSQVMSSPRVRKMK